MFWMTVHTMRVAIAAITIERAAMPTQARRVPGSIGHAFPLGSWGFRRALHCGFLKRARSLSQGLPLPGIRFPPDMRKGHPKVTLVIGTDCSISMKLVWHMGRHSAVAARTCRGARLTMPASRSISAASCLRRSARSWSVSDEAAVRAAVMSSLEAEVFACAGLACPLTFRSSVRSTVVIHRFDPGTFSLAVATS